MKTKLLSLFVALFATTALWASNTITYTATSKLTETTDTYSAGLHTNAFNTAISSHTFSNGTGTITFSGEITTIGDYAFYNCSSLTSITIPSSVTTIGSAAFRGCSGLTSVTIPNSVTTIGNYAFRGCSGLTSPVYNNTIFVFMPTSYTGAYTIPNGITQIAGGAFDKCSGLTSVTIPNSVTTIGTAAFENCSGLTSVTIPNSVTTIGKEAFYGCSGLTSVTIPNSVTTIGNIAFSGCSGLTSVTIGNSVTTIGEGAFSGCSGLTKTNYTGTIADWCRIKFGDNPISYSHNFYINDVEIKDLVIHDGVDTIGERAFSDCSGLTSVTIGNSVTTIGEMAFYKCSGLTKTNYTGTIADWCKIKFGGSSANPMYYSHNFYINDVEVKDLVISDGVDTIGYYAFRGCSGLTSPVYNNTIFVFMPTSYTGAYTIPNGITQIAGGAFDKCSGLTSVTIPNSVTDIGLYAFAFCSSLTSVTIPNSVTTIRGAAFEYCSGLTSVTIPNSVTTIGNAAFADCSGLTSVTIGNSVTTIEKNAFYGCSGLTSVTIGNSVTTIGDRAFYGCSGLTSVTIPNSVTTIGVWAFANCSSLTSVTIPNSVTTIGERAFYACSGLTSVTIGNSVTTIGNYAFCYCRGLTSVTIGNSITTIGDWAFADCRGLKSITCEATTPPTCGTDCFYGVSKSIPVYVHARSVDIYKKANEWRNFTNIQVSPEDYAMITCYASNGTITGGGKLIKGDTCTLKVKPDWGYQFTQWNDGNTDNPRSVVITQDSTFTAQIDIAQSGQCGDDLYWRLVGDTLIITGNGEMYDYTESHLAEWYLSNDKITKLIMDDGLTAIGDSAFYGLSNKNLKEIAIPNSVEAIGKYAFAECSYLKTITLGAKLEDIDEYAFQNDERLIYINCYAEEPPILQENAFDNYDIYLQVLCEVLDEYKVAKGWKLFNKENVSCLSAEGKTVTGDDVIVTPSATEATFIWPANDQADSYSLKITKDGVVFCTLKFNANGQLTGIAFAPSRSETHAMPAATMTSNGWQFTVTGLNQASKYAYTMDVTDVSQKTIKTYTGVFYTTGGVSTDLPSLSHEGKDGIGAVKMIMNGQLYILRDNKLYNAAGAEVK